MRSSTSFVALDFETANRSPASACALALVRVEAGAIVRREVRLIRPPSSHFEFTYIHGLAWDDVCESPRFAAVWRELSPLLEDAAFLAAHNARFDRSVLEACCRDAGLRLPALPFRCTVELARRAWHLRPARLPDVCRHLGLALDHHDPLSDAEACARIVLAAESRAAASGTGRPTARRIRPDGAQRGR
jgi:DNA polymerase-3 subunit epsilon